MELDQRIDRLERSSRLWQRCCMALLLALTLLIGVSATKPAQEEIKTKTLTIVNDAGQPCAMLTTTKGRGVLYIIDQQQKLAAVLGADDKGSALMLNAAGQTAGVQIEAAVGVGGTLAVCKPTGKHALMIWPENDQGNISVYGPGEAKIWSAP